MNYEERIAALKAKGILSESDADRLQSTLKQQATELLKARHYMLETIGIVLLGAVVVYLLMQAGAAEGSGAVEEVSRTLNASRTGVSASHALLLLLAGFVAVAYLGLYALVHRFYNALWRMQEEMIATGVLIADLEVRQSDMHTKSQQLLSQEGGSKKAAKTAMQIGAELDRELGELQRIYASLQAVCRQKHRAFPYTMAALAGRLPECK